jgi:hypothetical protein
MMTMAMTPYHMRSAARCDNSGLLVFFFSSPSFSLALSPAFPTCPPPRFPSRNKARCVAAVEGDSSRDIFLVGTAVPKGS